MHDGDESTVRDHEAFDLLGHEIRLAIIERLAKERRSTWRASAPEFAELRRSVGIDDAGQFNYHLDKLLGTFVGKREGEYVLMVAGLDVAGTVRAGTVRAGPYDADDVSFSATIDATCTDCDDQLEATYERGTLQMHCPKHGLFHGNAIPPVAVRDRDPETIVALAQQNVRSELDRALQAACVPCRGTVDVETPLDPPKDLLDHQQTDPDEVEQVVDEFACQDCEMVFWTAANVTVLDHPAVVSFYHDPA